MNSKISKGVEHLFAKNTEDSIYDVLVIGSGYGGSISSEMLAGHKTADGDPLKVVVLERGLEYRPGDFPDVEAEMPAHIRYAGPDSKTPSGEMEGLYDLRFGNDLLVAQANGVGGGSLINAGVMEQPTPNVFDTGWPEDIHLASGETSLDNHFKEVEILLGATSRDGDNTIELHKDFGKITKFTQLEKLAGKKYQERTDKTRITVSMSEGFETSSNVKLRECNLCGDCVSGCNYGAKNSLDYSVLHGAYRKGAEIFSGATVLRIKKLEDQSWALDVVYTNEKLRLRDPKIHTLRAKNVIVSAGSLGSTELLNLSETNTLKFSPMLGKGFSSNGDIWLVGFNQNWKVNGIADECIAPHLRKIGPTITGMIDLRDTDQKVAFQEMAVPAMFRRIFGETYKTADTIYSLGDLDNSDHSDITNTLDPAALNPEELERTSLYAAMTEDHADGFLRLNYKQDYNDLGAEELSKLVPGTMTVDWPELKYKELLNLQVSHLENLSADTVGGRILSSPTWRPLPESLMSLSANTLGPPVSVHPLGGCRMADDVHLGVVNSYGQVFDPLGNCGPYHKGLFVMDGAIIPKCLGINPALTIAAVTHRAATKLLSELVQEIDKQKLDEKLPPIEIDEIKTSVAVERNVTKTEIIERMSGPIQLSFNGEPQDYILEFTLKSEPKRFDVVANSNDGPIYLNKDILKYNAPPNYSAKGYNHLRIYKADDWHSLNLEDRSESAVVNGRQELENIEVRLDKIAEYTATVSGQFSVLNREPTTTCGRILRSITAWIFNRGTRDLHKLLRPKDYEPQKPKSDLKTKIKWAGRFFSIMIKNASHAGEVRSLIYNLEICKEGKNNFDTGNRKFTLTKLRVQKHFSFTCRSNPWRQLSEARITEFDLKSDCWSYEPMERSDIQLDTHFLYRNKTPLFRIVEQDNQVTAMMDVVSFLAYLFRQLLLIHFWSFRSPDLANPLYFNPSKRFAYAAKGLPEPVSFSKSIRTPSELVNDYGVASMTDIRLTGFRQSKPTHEDNPPVLLIHGYSASSSSFAHESIPTPLAKKLFDQGKDVWTLDLRTSSAFEYAKFPWKFEDIAQNDIPLAIKYLFNDVYKGTTKIDVVGHCMGATMLSMAILENKNGFADSLGIAQNQSALKPKHYINSVVLSQGSPTVVLSPDNTFRSFIGSYVKEIFPQDYQFRPNENSQNVVDRILDLVLSTLPYDGEDYTAHFPWYKPWRRMTYTRTRHRMDALYGRTFNLSNMDGLTLKHIDELFGPVSIETMTQIMHFAKLQTITNRKGHNEYVSHENLNDKWRGIPTLNIQCLNNGVIDVTTQKRTARIFKDAGVPLHTHLVDDERIGHQDSIIGVHADEFVFKKMGQFLADPQNFDAGQSSSQSPSSNNSSYHGQWIPMPPKYGPILIPEHGKPYRVLAGSDEMRAEKTILVLVPVTKGASKYQIVDNELKSAIQTGLNSFGSVAAQVDENQNWMTSELNPITNPKIDGCIPLFLYKGSPNLGFSKRTSSPKEHLEFIKGNNIKGFLPEDVIRKLNSQIEADRGIQMYTATTASTVDAMGSGGGLDIDPVLTEECSENSGVVVSDGRVHSTSQAIVDALAEKVKEFFDSPGAEISKLESCLVVPPLPTEVNREFVLGSCRYPAGFVDTIPASESYRILSEYLDKTSQEASPDLLVLLGDQIYSDATAGLFDPRASYDKHILPYFKFYGDSHVKQVFRRLPATMMLDDHEIVNNWEPLRPIPENNTSTHRTNVEKNNKLLREGVHSFFKYQRGTDPEYYKVNGFKLWYEHCSGQNHFFYLDARVDRSNRNADNIDKAYLVSKRQYQDLIKWLEACPKDEFKFICSGPIFLPRNRTRLDELRPEASAIRHDGWDGYPSTMIDLLSFIFSKNIENVIFLSGDEHLDCYAKADIKTKEKCVTIRSIHCSGIYSPMPFANGKEHNLMANDEFSFEYQTETGATIRPICTVISTFDLNEIADDKKSMWGNEPVEIEKLGGFALIKPKTIRGKQ